MEAWLQSLGRDLKTKYNYDKVKFVAHNEKVTIACNIHGEFQETPNKHFLGRECPKCEKLQYREEIAKMFKRHCGRYLYPKKKNFRNKSHIIIKCKTHGKISVPKMWHEVGYPCSKCFQEDPIKQFRLVHGDRYEYPSLREDYNSGLTIVCREHGEFKISSVVHLEGYGCRTCCNKWKSL